MNFYLSSYKIGNEGETLRLFFDGNTSVGYIPNAFDFTKANTERCKAHIESDMQALRELGLEVQLLDLKSFFGKKGELAKVIGELGGVWVSGGNVFVLRQAMKLSGFDDLLRDLVHRADFTYGGYSAAGCVLSSRLDAYDIVDDPDDLPYPELTAPLREGIGLIPFVFLPHFNSDHPESADINKEVAYCKDQGLAFKTLQDGEVLIIPHAD